MDDGSCNHITCSVCGCEFCWLCMKEISDLHYLSPSGCTFWGKKPWSRKKKILWQLGTLIGAPVGIALIAGVAVPAILIGLPIWSGRKVYVRYKSIGKHRRNMVVVGTVAGTIVIAPLVAALAVGIGVPILLAYVYGVVPISLCRSGGCGVTKNNNGGVRFAFDDEQNNGGGSDTNTFFNFSSMMGGGGGGSSKTNNETNKNTVSIPISAIEPKAPTDSILLNNLLSKNNSDSLSNADAAAKSSQQQTPVMVTITLANKSSSSSTKYKSSAASAVGSSSAGTRQHHRHRSTSSSNGSSSRTKSHRHSSSKHKKNAAGVSSTCAATFMQTQPVLERPSVTNSSASITCGLVDHFPTVTCGSSNVNSTRQNRSKTTVVAAAAAGGASNDDTTNNTATLAASETDTVASAIQHMTKSMQSDTLSSSSFMSNQVSLVFSFLLSNG
jgi:hypothetical protein